MEMSIRFPNLELTLGYVPKAFRIMGVEITIYGILIALGMLMAAAFIVLEAKRRNQNQNHYLGMMILTIPAAAAGARFLYVLCNWSHYEGNTEAMLDIRNGGMMWYGALLGGTIMVWLYTKIARMSFGQAADIAGMGILIGQVIGRWGDFFNRASFGQYTDSRFAMQLPLSAVRASEVTDQMRQKLQTVDGVSYIQVHPTFLYESVWCLLLLIVLLAYNRRKRFQGELFMRYLAGYGLGRCVIEWLRTDQVVIPGTPVSLSLVISALLFAVFGVTAAVRRKMAKKRAAAKRRRREKIYDEQERAEAEAARAEAEAEARARKAREEAEELMAASRMEDASEEEAPLQDQEAAEEAEPEDPIQEGSGREYWTEL